MNVTEQYINDYAVSSPTFRTGELFNNLSAKVNITKKALSWYLNKLVKEQKIYRVGHGIYSTHSKQKFMPHTNKKTINISKALQSQFPLLSFCTYNGEILAPLQHHLSYNNNIYIETERDATETVFHFLQDSHTSVFLTPDEEMMSDYVHLDQHAIIVKPLVTESPLLRSDGIIMPTLEKLLVDIQCDQDFYYLQGTETDYIMDNAFNLFEVNTSMLLRYAGRRNIKKEIEQYLNSHKNDR